MLQTAGLVCGLAGIWLVSRPADEPAPVDRAGLPLAVFAGLMFGGFFVLIAQVERGLIYTPLVLAKVAALLFALAAALVQREAFPSPRLNPGAWWIALLAGVLDAGGNVFYLLAHQYTRLDIAAILASMYPGSTVLLSALLLHERLGRGQRAGLLLCLLALALIAA
jgi:drug/metabolite transporter (DMT)-like permease